MNMFIISRHRTNAYLFLPLLFVFITAHAAPAAATLPNDMHVMAMASIDYVYNEKFKLAEDESKKLMKKYPDHPAGYFFYAITLMSWMEFYQSDSREDEFYRMCDAAIEKGEIIQSKDPSDYWAIFFMGGADGAKGTYESRYEKWITSFRHGWKGVSTLQGLLKKNPDLKDIYYGLGMYDYWRSALTKILWWMPGIENKIEIGMKEMLVAKNEGIYTSTAASANLIPMMVNEKRYSDAFSLSEEMLSKYPGSLVFCWGKGEALFGLGKYEDAEQVFRYILGRVESEPFDNHYNAALCHVWLAKIYLKTKRYTQSVAECNRMGYYKFDDNVKKRLDRQFSEATKVKEQAMAANIKNSGAEFVP